MARSSAAIGFEPLVVGSGVKERLFSLANASWAELLAFTFLASTWVVANSLEMAEAKSASFKATTLPSVSGAPTLEMSLGWAARTFPAAGVGASSTGTAGIGSGLFEGAAGAAVAVTAAPRFRATAAKSISSSSSKPRARLLPCRRSLCQSCVKSAGKMMPSACWFGSKMSLSRVAWGLTTVANFFGSWNFEWIIVLELLSKPTNGWEQISSKLKSTICTKSSNLLFFFRNRPCFLGPSVLIAICNPHYFHFDGYGLPFCFFSSNP